MVNISTWLKPRQKSPKKKLTRPLTVERLEDRLTPTAGVSYNPLALMPQPGSQGSQQSSQPAGNQIGVDSGGGAGQFNAGDNLVYHGGPLIQNVNFVPIYITDANSGTVVSAAEQAQFRAYLTSLATRGYIRILNGEYSINGMTIGNGTVSAFTGADTITPDGTVSGSNSMSNGQLAAAAQKAATAVGPNANNLYVVFAPPGDVVTFGAAGQGPNSINAFLGFHSAFGDSNGVTQDYYAVISDETSVNANLAGFGLSAFQGETQVISHEAAEAITDPDVSKGWFGAMGGASENGDQAANQSYTQNGYQVQYNWSNVFNGPAHALGNGPQDLFINQVTPPAVTSSTGSTPIATFTTANTSLTASDFSATVFFGGSPAQNWTVNSITGGNGHFIVNATPSSLAAGQHGTKFQQEGLYVIIHDNGGPPAANGDQPVSVRYQTYAVSANPAPLVYNADPGGAPHNFLLKENLGSGNFELYDYGDFVHPVFVQAIASTTDIDINANPTVNSSLIIDYSGGVFKNKVNFDGGPGLAPHKLTIKGGNFTNETFSPTGANSGSFSFSGDATDPGLISFVNTTLAVDTSTVANVTYNASTTFGDTISIINDPNSPEGGVVTDQINSGSGAFVSVDFGNKNNVKVNTNAANDTVNLTPSATMHFSIVGTDVGESESSAGDVLKIDVTGLAASALSVTGLVQTGDDLSGTYTLGATRNSVQFSNFDDIEPNLVLSQTAPVNAGEGNVAFVVKIVNNGPSRTVTLNDLIPTGATFVSSDDPGYDPTTGMDTFTIGSGATMTITLTFNVVEEGVTITNVANLTGGIVNKSSSLSVNIIDAALTAGTLTPPSVAANVPLTDVVLFHFTDADPAGTASDYNATVVWGDGTTETSSGNPTRVQVVANGGGFDVVGSHTYATTLSNVTFSVSVADHGAAPVGGSKTNFSVKTSTLTAGALTSPVVAEGGAVTNFVLLHFTDSNATDTVLNFNASVNWGDGTRETSAVNPTDVQVVVNIGGGFDVVGSHRYLEEVSNAAFVVSVANSGVTSASVANKNFNVADAALTAGTLAPPVATEDGAVTNVVLFHFTDADPNAAASDYTATVTWGDGNLESSSANPADVSVVASAGGGFNVVGSHTYQEELSNATFIVFVADRGTASASATASFNVLDAALTAGTLTSPVVTEGSVVTNLVLFHFTDADPNGTASDYNATVTWGDGSVETSGANPAAVSVVANGNGFDVVGSHLYGEEQAGATFSVSVADNGAAPAAASAAGFSVADSALTAGTLTVPASTEGFPSTSGVVFHFTDADVNGAAFDYIATVNWGDGTSNSSNDGTGLVTVAPNIGGGFDVFAGAHVLQSEETNGHFSVVVADKGGAAASASVVFNAPDAPLTPIAVTPFTPNVGTPFSSFPLFHFSDVDPFAVNSDFIATVFWGDGSVENSSTNPADVQVVSDGFSGFYVTGSHSYPIATPTLLREIYVSDVGGAAPIRGAIQFSVGGDVIINGTAGDDTVVVNAADATSGTYTLNGGPAVAFAGVNSLTFSGGGGNDHLIIHNFAGGEFAPPGGFTYDGGPGGTGTLNVDAAGSFFRTRPGVIEVGDPLVISYANVSSIQLDNGVAVNALAGQDTVDRDTAFIGLNPQERFVQALYLDELGRAGARSELQPWVGVLSVRGTAAVASAIDHSVEARVHLVNSWYLEYLGRAPGAGETAGWAGLLLQGKSEEFVLGNILATPEFYAKAQTLSSAATADQRYVQALYLLLFNHPGDAGSVAGWVNTLPKQGRQGVAAAFLASPEFHLSNFEGYYNALLHRPASFANLQNLVFSTLDMETVRLAFEATPDFFANG